MLLLTRLALTNFRNYLSVTWRPEARVSVLLGSNGSGKTNLLEAISLLVPGRGLRGVRNAALARTGGASPDGSNRWGVAGRFLAGGDEIEIGTGTSPDNDDRRVFMRDGASVKNQEMASSRISILWLTPQMDRLFQDGASGRRAFLDRLTFALEPLHAQRVAAHERAVTSRNRLLAQGRFDPAWVAGIEDEIAHHAVAVAAMRGNLVKRLNHALSTDAAHGFPAAEIAMHCDICDNLTRLPALAVENWVRGELRERRKVDQTSGRTSVGVHRADMVLLDRASGVAASSASTGQQKSLLLAVVAGQAALIEAARGITPVLLLDEAAAHLDNERRAALAAAIGRLRSQIIVSGTDAGAYEELPDDTRWFLIEQGLVRSHLPSERSIRSGRPWQGKV